MTSVSFCSSIFFRFHFPSIYCYFRSDVTFGFKMQVIVLLVILSVVATETNEPNWHSYVDDSLLGSQVLQQAAIIGLDGETKAEGGGLELQPGEGQKIVELFNSPETILDTKFVVGGDTYEGLLANEKSISGYSSSFGDTKFIVLFKTKQTVLIGVYDDGNKILEAPEFVEDVGNKLISLGH